MMKTVAKAIEPAERQNFGAAVLVEIRKPSSQGRVVEFLFGADGADEPFVPERAG